MPSAHATTKPAKPAAPTAKEWSEHSVADMPITVRNALKEAMRLEGIPPTQYGDFLWLIAQESNGKVGARNSRSTARGLFQLLRAQYSLNPRGEASFGNATEECQGGIRYVMGRYGSARKAKDFWLRHHWY